MTVAHAFLIDAATGRAKELKEFPSLEIANSYPLEEGEALAVFDPALGDPSQFQTEMQDGAIVFVVREPDLEVELIVARARKQAQISAAFADATQTGCDSPWGRVDCDEVAQGRITRLVELIERTGLTDRPVNFTRYDRTQVEMSYADLVQLGIVVGSHFLALFDVKQAKERALAEAETLTDIAAIDAAADWP